MANPAGLVVEPVVPNRLGIFPESATAVLADWQRRLDDLPREQPLPETGAWASVVPSFEAFAIEVVPAISDDVVEQVRTKLLVLGGQILQYRALDVEQIGSVHEGIMGFAVERASGPSPGITHRPAHQRIMITEVVNAEQLLAQAGAKRAN